jgi:hypothetical protein
MVIKRACLAIVFAVGVAGLAASQDRRGPDFETLEGTWLVTVTPVGRAPAQIFATYARGGRRSPTATPPSRPSAVPGRETGSGSPIWSSPRPGTGSISTHPATRPAGANSFQSIAVDPTLERFAGRSRTRIFDRNGTLMTTVEGTLQAIRVRVIAIE